MGRAGRLSAWSIVFGYMAQEEFNRLAVHITRLDITTSRCITGSYRSGAMGSNATKYFTFT